MLNLRADALDPIMKQIFSGNTVENETVMFIDKTDVKTLLFDIEKVVKVTSYDGKTVFTEGVDYTVESGKLKLTENSSIPCITSEKYYHGKASSPLITKYKGKNVHTLYGEGKAMTDWQINVTYTHNSSWEGFLQECKSQTYQNLINKFKNGEDVSIFFYGDSITYGANSSYISDYAPYQHSFPLLFTQALADLFEYTVVYKPISKTADNGNRTARTPLVKYEAGQRGTITYTNTAIGGWTSSDGLKNIDDFVTRYSKNFGCDLFVLGFGMNDGSYSPDKTANNIKEMADAVLKVNPEASILIISTMLPNPNAVNGWYGNQYKQEAALMQLADEYKENGIPCEVAQMTSTSASILNRKDFNDYSGNNINHPNDFFSRVYAQCLLQTVIGYGNIK